MVNMLFSFQSEPPVYFLATPLSFQNLGHLFSHCSEIFFRKTSYLLFFCLFWYVFISTFTDYIFLSLFIWFRSLWFGSPFCRLQRFGSNLWWNLIFVGGIEPVSFQGLMFGIVCACGLSGGTGSLLHEVQ